MEKDWKCPPGIIAYRSASNITSIDKYYLLEITIYIFNQNYFFDFDYFACITLLFFFWLFLDTLLRMPTRRGGGALFLPSHSSGAVTVPVFVSLLAHVSNLYTCHTVWSHTSSTTYFANILWQGNLPWDGHQQTQPRRSASIGLL